MAPPTQPPPSAKAPPVQDPPVQDPPSPPPPAAPAPPAPPAVLPEAGPPPIPLVPPTMVLVPSPFLGQAPTGDDFDLSGFMSDLDNDGVTTLEETPHDRLFRVLNNPSHTPTKRAKLKSAIEATLNPSTAAVVPQPTRGPKKRFTDRNKSVEVLLVDPRFRKSSKYWQITSIESDTIKTRPFPVSKHNCADLASLFQFSCGGKSKVHSYNSAVLAIGHYIHYSVCLLLVKWDALVEMKEPGVLWMMVCDTKALAAFIMALENKYSANSQRSYVMAIMYFLGMVYSTNKDDIIKVSSLSAVQVDDQYHRARGKLLALAADLKKAILTQKTLSAALSDRVETMEMLPLEAYKYFLEASAMRIQHTYGLVEPNILHGDDPPTLDPISDLFQRVCIHLQTSMVINTEGQRKQIYDHLYVNCLHVRVYGIEGDVAPSMLDCSDGNMEQLKKILKEVMGKYPPYAVTFRYYNDTMEKRMRHASRPFFQWNVGGKSGVVVLLYYLIYLRPQFVEKFGDKLQGRDKNALFFHTKSGVRLTAHSIFNTANKSYGMMVGYSGQPEETKLEWVAPRIGPTMMRRTFATHAFVSWKKGEAFTECNNTDEFLAQCSARMNTSEKELKDTYIATQTPVDAVLGNPTPLLGRASVPELNDEGGYDDDDGYGDGYDDEEREYGDEYEKRHGGGVAYYNGSEDEEEESDYGDEDDDEEGDDEEEEDRMWEEAIGEKGGRGGYKKMGKVAAYSLKRSPGSKRGHSDGYSTPKKRDGGEKRKMSGPGSVQKKRKMVKKSSVKKSKGGKGKRHG